MSMSRRCRSDLLAELSQRVRRAVALPVRIAVKDIYDETCTELLISAPLDSGALLCRRCDPSPLGMSAPTQYRFPAMPATEALYRPMMGVSCEPH